MCHLHVIHPQGIVPGRQVVAGQQQVAVAVISIVVQAQISVGILQINILACLYALVKGEHHIGGLAARNTIQHIAACHNRAAIEVNAQIGVDARIHAVAAGIGIHDAAVDDQPAVGVNAVPFARGAIDRNIQLAAVHGGDGNAVFIGVDAVVAGIDFDFAAIDGQMQFGIQTFIFRFNVQHTAVFRAAVDVHRHLGVECAVVLMELLGVNDFLAVIGQHHGLINTRHIRPAHMVDAAVGEIHIGTGCGSVHILGSGIGIITAAFVNIVEDHRRCHRAGHVHTIEHQCDHRIGVFLGILAQIHGDLPTLQCTAEDICTRLGNGQHRMCSRFLGSMCIRFRAFPVGKVAARFIIHDVVGYGHTRSIGIGNVHIHPVGKPLQVGDVTALCGGVCVPVTADDRSRIHIGSGLGRIRAAAGCQRQQQRACQDQRNISFHKQMILSEYRAYHTRCI